MKKSIVILFILLSVITYGQTNYNNNIYFRMNDFRGRTLITDSCFTIKRASDSLIMTVKGEDIHFGGSIDSIIFDKPTNITAGLGSGTVTSIATRSPIGGGTITTSGEIYLSKTGIDSLGTIILGVWNGSSIDTLYLNGVSRITASSPVQATAIGKGFRISVDTTRGNPNLATQFWVDSIVSAGGSGSVTSITGGFGLTGGTITSSGTLAVDTSAIATPYDISLKVNVSDTAAMLANYARDGDLTGKLNISDTAAMLSHYIDLSDTSAMLSNYVRDGDLSGFVTSVSGTTNRITSTGGTTPVIDISSSYVGQSSITTTGTLTSGAIGSGFTAIDTARTNAASRVLGASPITVQTDGKTYTVLADTSTGNPKLATQYDVSVTTAFNATSASTRVVNPNLGSLNLGTTTVLAALQEFFYPSQVPTASMLNLSGSSTWEKRSAGSTNMTFRWTACRQASTANISTIVVAGNSKTGFTQPSAPGCVTWTGSGYGDTTISVTNNTNSNYTTTVTTTDSKTASSTASVIWSWKRYWGRSTSTTPTEAEILAAAGGGSEFSEAAVKNNFTITASGSNHAFYAYISSAGTLSSIVVGGLEQFGNFTTSTRSVTNALGGTVTYRIYTTSSATSGNVVINTTSQ